MQQRTLGSSNITVAPVGLGAWAIGGGPWWGDNDDVESIHAIHAALDVGVNLIDTAPVYGFGHSEEIVGRAIAGRRDQVVLATKCGLWWDDATGVVHFTQSGHTVRRSLAPRTIVQEVENSLRRLRTDHLDLLQTHWQAVEPVKTPIAETMACLMDLKRQGKIRAIGASNATPADLDEYRRAGTLDVCQLRYSLLDRRLEAELLPYCLRHGIGTLVYSPLEMGLLTGKVGLDQEFPAESIRHHVPWFKPANRRRVLDLLAGWSDLTARYRCSLAQLVIAWTVQQAGVTCALCGARRPADAVENAGALRVQLAAADLARIRQAAEALGAPQA